MLCMRNTLYLSMLKFSMLNKKHKTLYNKGEISTKRRNYFTCLMHKPTQQLIIHNCDTRLNEFS